MEVLQARILEWVAISFSRGSSWPTDQTQVSHAAGRFFAIWATREAELEFRVCNYEEMHANPWRAREELFYTKSKLGGCSCCNHVWLFMTATLWTLSRQAPLSTGFSRQEYSNGLPSSPPGDLPYPGIELADRICLSYISCIGRQVFLFVFPLPIPPPGKPIESWLFTGWVLARKEQSSFFLLGSVSVTASLSGLPYLIEISVIKFFTELKLHSVLQL